MDSVWTQSLKAAIDSVPQPPLVTPQRSGTCYYRSALLLIKFLLWRKGFDTSAVKAFSLFLRLAYFSVVEADLAAVPPTALQPWECDLLSIACKQVARATLKARSGSLITPATEANCVVALQKIQARCQPLESGAQGVALHSLCLPPPSTVIASALPLSDHLINGASSEVFAGPIVSTPDRPTVDLVGEGGGHPKSLNSISKLLKAAQGQCEALRARAHSSNASLAMYFTCSVIETLFLEVLPVPVPPAPDAAPCPWSTCDGSVSVDCQSRVLLQLQLLMATYVTAVKSLPQFSRLEGKQIVTSSAMFTCFDATLRLIPSVGVPLAISRLLGRPFDPSAPSSPLWVMSSRSFGGLSMVERTEACLITDPVVSARRHLIHSYWSAYEQLLEVQGERPASSLFSFASGVRYNQDSDVIRFLAAYTEALGLTGAPKDTFAVASAEFQSTLTTVTALSELERLGLWFASSWETHPEFVQLRSAPSCRIPFLLLPCILLMGLGSHAQNVPIITFYPIMLVSECIAVPGRWLSSTS